jgi:hypothetical protein
VLKEAEKVHLALEGLGLVGQVLVRVHCGCGAEQLVEFVVEWIIAHDLETISKANFAV